MSSARPLLAPLFLLLLLAGLLAPLPAAAGFTNVSVTLTGPDEGWNSDNLEYNANPVCEVDAETQAKISNGEAILTTALYWNWGPATLVAGGGPSDATTTLRYDNCWAGYYTVSVAYLCSLMYTGGGADYAYDDTASRSRSSG